jgi:hypothetical protein
VTVPKGFFSIDFKQPEPSRKERAFEVILGFGIHGMYTYQVHAVSHNEAIDKAHERHLADASKSNTPRNYRSVTVRYRDLHEGRGVA